MSIVFCHGLESEPHGRKYQSLVSAGFEVEAPDFRGMNLAERVARLHAVLERRAREGAARSREVVVGSSYGGITALCTALELEERGAGIGGLVLCAPALGRREPPASTLALRAPCPTVIIHGRADTVCPIAPSRALASASDDVTLLEVDDEHRLASSLDQIVDATRAMLARVA